MNYVCPLCHKDMQQDPGPNSIGRFELYVCNLCMAPHYDSMYKELYSNTTITPVIEGAPREKFVSKMLLAQAILVDEFYVVLYHNYYLNHNSCPSSFIYKDIVGTVAHSLDFEPITIHSPICILDFTLELPWHDIKLIKNKLKTYAVFS